MSAPASDERDETRKILRALKETILNLESLCEQAERILKRAQSRLAEFPGDDEAC